MARRRAQQTALFAEEHWLRTSKPVSPQARAMCVKPGRTKREAPAPKPWEAVILAVDTAKNSGWSSWADGRIEGSGELDTDNDAALRELCGLVATNARAYGRTAVLVLEFWWGGNAQVCAGLHVHCDRWTRAWKAAGESLDRVVKVQPGQWRGPVLGSWSVGKRSAEVCKAELATAQGIVGRNDVGSDEAPAILIGRWASYAPQVGDVIGKRARDKSMKAWTGGAR
jgi:hypothetical protein